MDLYFTKKDIERLKETKDERLNSFITDVLKVAEKALEIEVLQEENVSTENGRGGNIHENYFDASRPFQKNMLYLAFAYMYTEKEEYFEKAKALMLTYAGYKKWHGKGYHGKSELNTMFFCVGMAIGYHFFKDKLTDDERKIIVEGTYKLGIITTLEDWVLQGTKIHAIDTMGHNWWVVCVSGAGLAAVVMEDEIPDGKKLVNAVVNGVEEWFKYRGNPINAKPVNSDKGGFYESVSYADMSYEEYLKFRCAYRNKYGKLPFDDIEILTDAANYFVKTSYMSDKDDYYIPFGDCPGKGVAESAFALVFEGIDCEGLKWYLQNTKHRNINLMDVLAYSQIWEKPALPPEKKSVFYEKIGWSVWRDSYENNSTMFAVKCGDTWNHAHADAGHFVLYKDGYPIIRDSGSCDYANPQYEYFLSSLAHNVVFFDGKGQDKRDLWNHARLKGHMYNFVDQEGFKYVTADVTGPMSRYFRKYLRHFLWLDGFILIYDDIECYEKGKISFLLHAEENCGFKMLTPYTLDKVEGFSEGNKPSEIQMFTTETEEECRGKLVSVIALKDNLNPKLIDIEDGYKVVCGDTTVYINKLSDGRIMHRNCINVMDDYTTDAVIITENKGRYGVVNGSIIRKKDEIILDTVTRKTGLL